MGPWRPLVLWFLCQREAIKQSLKAGRSRLRCARGVRPLKVAGDQVREEVGLRVFHNFTTSVRHGCSAGLQINVCQSWERYYYPRSKGEGPYLPYEQSFRFYYVNSQGETPKCGPRARKSCRRDPKGAHSYVFLAANMPAANMREDGVPRSLRPARRASMRRCLTRIVGQRTCRCRTSARSPGAPRAAVGRSRHVRTALTVLGAESYPRHKAGVGQVGIPLTNFAQ
jgi:hypothetical protein